MQQEAKPAWQQGFELAELKAYTELFDAHDKGLILGAFTGVSERAVADWLAEGRLVEHHDGAGAKLAAVVWQKQSRRVPVKDFTRETVCYQEKGDLVIKRIAFAASEAGLEAAEDLLVALAAQREPGAAFWLESFVEHKGDAELRRELELHHICTKIPASSELIGVYCSLDFDALMQKAPDAALERFPEEDDVLVKLPLRFDPEPALLDLAAADASFADHYSSKNKGRSWGALALRGYNPADETLIHKPAEMSKKWKAENPEQLGWELGDTRLRAAMPACERLIELIPGEKHRIRLMRLAPGGGELERHADITDPDAGVADGKLIRVHMPLRTNPAVVFEAWDTEGRKAEAHMGAGEVWVLDTRKPHTAVNGGSEERIHLVIDVESGPELRALMRAGEEA